MKKKSLFITFIIIATVNVVLNAQTNLLEGKRITVPEPTLNFGSEEDKWIPISIQGQVSHNFQNYSGLDVVDRQNLDKVKQEQKISESGAYSEADQIATGKLVAANYIVAVNITKKGNNFAIDAKIDDAETGKPVGKAYNNPNCFLSQLDDGSETNALCYALLKGIGVDETKLAELQNACKTEAEKIRAQGNTNVAKGIIAQRNENYFEAMNYFQKQIGDSSIISEAASRLNNLTANLSSGNIRDYAKNEIAFRKVWLKIWEQYAEFLDNNAPYLVYTTEIQRGKIDYTKETVEIKATVAYGLNQECENLYNRLYGAYKNLQGSHDVKNWNLKTSFRTKYQVDVTLYDANKKNIGKNNFTVTWNVNDFETSHSLPIETVSFICPIDSLTDNLSIDVKPNKKGGVVYVSN